MKELVLLKRIVWVGVFVFTGISPVPAQEFPGPNPVPTPPIVFRPSVVQKDELPVDIKSERAITADNGLFQQVETTIVFTNPNRRVFEGELEFPLPKGATVCGYALEIDGTMTPGVVCEKEAARVAFENERRQGVDPGVVEHVKGNVWKTRIYPLMPNVPRRAKITYVAEIATPAADCLTVVERDGKDVFVATRLPEAPVSRADRLRRAAKATIFWDASMSRHGRAAADRNLLECLPEKGEWTLIVFRNVIESARLLTDRAELLRTIDALVYDGGTCLEAVERMRRQIPSETFLFTDEIDVDAAAAQRIRIARLGANEKPPIPPKDGRLLAVAWAAQRVASLAATAVEHRQELLDLGRTYGVASPLTSMIVLERLDQYLRYRIEPPKTSSFHGEWVRRRAAEDDPIAREREKTRHRASLLHYWEERIRWWKDPIPPKRTPSSGLFERSNGSAVSSTGNAMPSTANVARLLQRSAMSESAGLQSAEVADVLDDAQREPVVAAASVARKSPKPTQPVSSGAATIKISAWNPQTPYLKALDGVAREQAYAEYLKQREIHGSSPAFYLDSAGWFFKASERELAVRIISCLSEMKLEDVGLWRTMGWRLREAGAIDEAVAAFRHVLAERAEEPQSRRDLALVLTERAKERFARGDRAGASQDLTEALAALQEAAFVPMGRRSGREGNDLQTSVLALEELNGVIAWIEAQDWDGQSKPAIPHMDEVFRRDLPLRLRIVMSWDTDETDVDLHVLEPNGEEAFYMNRRTTAGGFVSEDVTTGYGPEEYLRKDADSGVYKILAHYYASHRQALSGPATVTATVYTDWGRKEEKRRILSFRLDRPKDKCPVGEVTIE